MVTIAASTYSVPDEYLLCARDKARHCECGDASDIAVKELKFMLKVVPD